MITEQEPTISFFRFEDLRIYAKALDYITWLHQELAPAGLDVNNHVVKPLLKSAHGIALNVAEGSARNKSQFVYYLKMAKSSVRECVVFTEIASKLSVMDENQKDYSRNQLMELTKMIGSLVASLQRTTPNLREEEPEGLPDNY